MPHKVLIAEDEIHIRSLLEQTLEYLEDVHSVTILTAANGLEALEIIQQEHPRLVILDIMMPQMNGYEVCRRIREQKAFDDTRIILLTAKGQEADRKKGLCAGAQEYITKPFDPDEVLALAARLMDLPLPGGAL